jgi:beta propeller repeat protein
MAKDSSNTFANAKLLKSVGNGIVKETIGGRDRRDFIKFNLTQRSTFNTALTKLKAKANLDLLDASGRRLQRSAKPGNKPESIATILDPGQYILKVSGKKQITRYRLTLNTTILNTTPLNTAPTLSTNIGTSVAKGSATTLNGNLLRATDPEQKAITYTLTQLPTAGKLKLNSSNMRAGQTFTQSDIDNGRLSYVNSGGIKELSTYAANFSPHISGSNVVWEGNDGNDTEIYFYNGSTTIQLTNNNTSDRNLQISGSNVVWEGNDGNDTEIYFYNGSTTVQLTNNDTDDNYPQISGSNVVWEGFGSNKRYKQIYLYNGSNTIQLTDNTINNTDPKISGSNVVWSGFDSINTGIYFYNGSTITQLINKSRNSYTRQDPGSIQISGSNVVWQNIVGRSGDDTEIYFYNGSTVTQLTNNNTDDRYPQISGSNVVWQASDGSDTGDKIYLYNGSTTIQLTSNNIKDRYPQISGSNVAWFGSNSNGTDIYLYDGSTTTQLTNNRLVSNTRSLQISESNVVWQDSGIYFSSPYQQPEDYFGFTVTDGAGGSTSGTFNFAIS